MPVPDIGLAPPPPVDVQSQMKPTGGPGGGAGGPLDLSALLATLSGGAPQPSSPTLTPKIMQVEPILQQIARQVPALGPDVDRLNVELKSRMGGLPAALAGLAGPMGAPPSGQPDLGVPPIGGPGAPMPAGAPPAGPGMTPGAPALPPGLPPNPATEMGAMDTAMQLEIQLPAIGQEDPTLMPYIQGFIARMRVEVPKVVQGDTEAVSPPPQIAPTDSMLSKIPITY